MKKIILNTIVILFLSCFNIGFSQVLEKPLKLNSERLKNDEFLNKRISLDDVFETTPCYVNCDVAGSERNLIFTTSSSSSFDVTLNNHNSIVRAAKNAHRKWHKKQLNIVKEHLDAKFGKRFSNYNEAKNAMFSDSERKNIIKSVNIAQPKYSNLRSSGFRKQKEHIKKLKLLRLRENEIKAGNVNNSKYGFIKAGNVYLKDLKSIKALNKHWYPLVSEFNKNTATTHINNYIYKAFGKTGINNKVVSAKNNYYNRLNDWDKLDFMQFLINYEYYKKYNSPPYAYSEKMSRLFKKFNKLEIATPSLVEDYAIKNRDGGVSVFDDNYWKVIYKKDYKVDYGNDFSGFGFANNYFTIRYIRSKNSKKKHKKLRKEALEKLLAAESTAESTAEFAIANFIGELGISNQSQKEWLHKYKTKTNELIKFANDNRVDGIISDAVKRFINKSLKVDVVLNNQFTLKSTEKYPQELAACCPGGCCPDSSIYSDDKIIKEYGIKPIQEAIDGSFNFLVATSELIGSEEWVGSRIRKIMNEIGVEIPSDVENEYLAAVYRIRKRDGILIVEYRPDLLRSMLDAGLDTLDMLSFLSPSRGGGAFLTIKAGGKITITKITAHIRKITINNAKINDAIRSIQNNAIFDLAGTGTYNAVRGHHPLAKSAFRGDKFYKYRQAFSVSANSLGGQAIHNAITGHQNRLYSAFKRTGEVLTLNKMAEIEIQAMVDAGIPRNIATGWVIKSLESLKAQGVKMITNIPWNGVN